MSTRLNPRGATWKKYMAWSHVVSLAEGTFPPLGPSVSFALHDHLSIVVAQVEEVGLSTMEANRQHDGAAQGETLRCEVSLDVFLELASYMGVANGPSALEWSVLHILLLTISVLSLARQKHNAMHLIESLAQRQRRRKDKMLLNETAGGRQNSLMVKRQIWRQELRSAILRPVRTWRRRCGGASASPPACIDARRRFGKRPR